MPYLNATREDLRIGLYIKIIGSWFSHPFATNNFKIASQKDLATIQSLRNVQIMFDPEQSDPLSSSVVKDNTQSMTATTAETLSDSTRCVP